MPNPFIKDNEFGTPFHFVEADEEVTHLQGVMANIQAYIDHPDTEEPTLSELRFTLQSLRLSHALLSKALSPVPRR